ncbi:MAG: hypothetical protein ACMXYA_00970 [Candidatus Woesearchaeota archaeon]
MMVISKKGQITLFILIGLLMLGITVVVLILIPSGLDSDFTRTQLTESSSTEALRTVLQSCLDSASDEAIYTIGLQGGKLYANQVGGTDDVFPSVRQRFDSQSVQVGFGLIRRQNEAPPPFYPVNIPSQRGFAYTLSYLESEFPGSQLWGENVLPKLCSRTGPNAPTSDIARYSCMLGTYGSDQNTIQDKIRRHIRERVSTCIRNQRDLFDSAFLGFVQESSELSVLLSDTSVRVTYTLDAQISQTESTAEIISIQSQVPVRLQRVYNLAYQLIEHDIRNIHFLMGQNYSDIRACTYPGTNRCWDSSMVVNFHRNRGTGLTQGADIIEIIDLDSNVKGNPYRFLFAVENRRPMLDLIDYDGSTPFPALVLAEKENFTFVPQGFDPDGDDLRYNYSGWFASTLYNSESYREGTGCSQKYRCANLTVPINETGLYQLEISVFDEWGLMDYQPLDIKVYGEGVEVQQWMDPVGVCPAEVEGYDLVICTTDDCVCQEGQYCKDVRPLRDTSLTCNEGSVCCTYKKSGSFDLECDRANCSGFSETGYETVVGLDCTRGASCEFTGTDSITGQCTLPVAEGLQTICRLSNIENIGGCTDLGVTCEEI